MHDEFDRQRVRDDTALTAALRALPTGAPPPGGWNAIAARIEHGRRRRNRLRVALPAALAASVALAITLPHWRPARVPASPTHVAQQAAVPARDSGSELNALRLQSQRLQAWVRALDRKGAPLSGDALAGAVALQDRIGLVDLQLSAATDPAARASLWQERNLLLQQLGLLHLQPYSVAEHTHATPEQTIVL